MPGPHHALAAHAVAAHAVAIHHALAAVQLRPLPTPPWPPIMPWPPIIPEPAGPRDPAVVSETAGAVDALGRAGSGRSHPTSTREQRALRKRATFEACVHS